MSIDENRAIIRRLYDAMNKGNADAIDELIAPNHVVGQGEGPEGFKRLVDLWWGPFPDLHGTIIDLVAEGDRVAVLVAWKGTHKEAFTSGITGAIPATGKPFSGLEAVFYRVVDGKIVESKMLLDWLHFVKQLGVTALPPQGEE